MNAAHRERVLILSLGTGSVIEGNVGIEEHKQKLETAISTGVFKYKETKYLLPNKPEIINSEFVADPLIREFQPDRVIIIGTIKSCWTSFYTKFSFQARDSVEFRKDVEVLDQIEYNNGDSAIEIGGDLLDESQNRINTIYKRALNPNQFPHVEALLIRYGISGEELRENYNRLSRLWEGMDQSTPYEVAFDITHSFRSIPFYNMTVLDYIRHVTDMDIILSHVYYGNLDARFDNDGVSPLVDLEELIEIMELAKGVSEFGNTGNSVTLQRTLRNESDESKRELIDKLRRFDVAIQVNECNGIIASLSDLLQFTETQENVSGPYGKLCEMLHRTLVTGLLQNSAIILNSHIKQGEDIHSIDELIEFQFLLTDWYRHIHRYGEATATALEALRSLLTPVYLKIHNNDWTLENVRNENNRKSTIDRLSRTADQINVDGVGENGIRKLIVDVEESRRAAKNIRDAFAHNLIRPGLNDVIGQIDKMIDNMKKLRTCVEEKNRDFMVLYGNVGGSGSSVVKHAKKTASNGIRIILSDSNWDMERYDSLTKTNKGNYLVFIVPESVIRSVFKNKTWKKRAALNTMALLGYLLKLLPVETETDMPFQIVFSNDSPSDWEQIVPLMFSACGKQAFAYYQWTFSKEQDNRMTWGAIPKQDIRIEYDEELWESDERIGLTDKLLRNQLIAVECDNDSSNVRG